MIPFDADTYWSTRANKKWVVQLIQIRGYNKAVASDTKLVRAKTREGAIDTARFHTNLTGRINASARLATPTDLGCMEATA